MSKDLDAEYLSSTCFCLHADVGGLMAKHPGLRTWDLGPLFQGFIMETIDSGYAGYLHQLPFNPYSQYCYVEDNALMWVVNALTNESYNYIVQPLLQQQKVTLTKYETSFEIAGFTYSRLARQALAKIVYESDAKRVKLNLVTPAAFKSAGSYQIIPSLSLMYQNLLMRYGQAFNGDKEADPEMVEYLTKNTLINGYSLSSRKFLLAKSKIPSFGGSITLELRGPQTLRGLANMLFQFASFSGIGIKTSMGMGGVRIE